MYRHTSVLGVSSTLRGKIYRQCRRKYVYFSEERARQVADKLMQENPKLSLRSYVCSYCGRWHLTSHQLPPKNA